MPKENTWREKLSVVELSLGPVPNYKGFVKIDGKKLVGIKTVEVASGLVQPQDQGHIPVVKIEFYAKNVECKVKGKIEKLIKICEKD